MRRRLTYGQAMAGVLGVALLAAGWSLTDPFLYAAADDGEPCRGTLVLPNPEAPDLDCAAPPNTFDVSRFFSANAPKTDRAEAGIVWDTWAWESFAAMNWPAQRDDTQPTGYVRGVPDLGASFTDAQPDDVLVWETFKEKRELFQPVDTPAPDKVNADSLWQALTFDSGQQPSSSDGSGGLPACEGTEPLEAGHHRLFSTSKGPIFNTGDETIEVNSPPFEAARELCAGYTDTTDPTHDACMSKIFIDNVVARPGVGPRVWFGDPGTDAENARPIYFEVKVNYDFWAYILEKGFYLDEKARAAAQSADRRKHPKLPFRTSAIHGPGRSPGAVFAYDASKVVDQYDRLEDPNRLPGVGSVQLKAAWLVLNSAERLSGRFHMTEGLTFHTIDPTNPHDEGNTCYRRDTFGLLALHIIQRVHANSFSRTNPELFAHGGTFIFATWEHASIGGNKVFEPTDFYYANYLTNDDLVEDYQTTPFPNFGPDQPALNVVRIRRLPLPSTQSVNRTVHDALPEDSVWRNYRLIGTQFVPVNGDRESYEYRQPYYLANLVVETNRGLQNFQGTPGQTQVTPYYTDKVGLESTGTDFEGGHPNVIFNRELNQPFLMGGCMGCHGVAQLKGYNFSFVFADGQAGSGLDTQRHFEVAGATPSPGTPETGTEKGDAP